MSLLIGELAFGTGSARDDHVKIGVLLGSLLRRRCSPPSCCGSATATTGGSAPRNTDADQDGIPDIYRESHTGNG